MSFSDDQVRLLKALSDIVHPVEVEGTDEIVPVEEVAESAAAWQTYQAGEDAGLSAEELKLRLFGGRIG